MTESSQSPSKVQLAVGYVLLALGVGVFAVRLIHAGDYAMPRSTPLFTGLAGLLLGALLVTSAAPGAIRRIALALSPVVLFFGLYVTMAELEEVVSLHATDSSGNPAELRLWIVDRDDGSWVGMQGSKAAEFSLDGARLDLLRNGQTSCVVPVLHDDRPTVRAIHAMKVDKYAVAQAAAAVGLYPSEARETTVALRLDPCPNG